jgi:hypothetical protein
MTMTAFTPRDRAMMLFGPYPVKLVDLQAAALYDIKPDSDDWRQLWAIWEQIDDERHANFPDELCDDHTCDKCGRWALGDDW